MMFTKMAFAIRPVVVLLCIVDLALPDETPSTAISRLRELLEKPGCHLMPGVYDGLSGRLVQNHPAEFGVAYMTGFGAAAARGYPDLGLLSAGDVTESARNIIESMSIAASETGKNLVPLLVDGDTGYGGSAVVRRTVLNFAAAGAAAISIEDQVSSADGSGGGKRCGHVGGKDVVSFEAAVERVRVACRARDEYEAVTGREGPLIFARTDVRGSISFENGGALEEGIRRCRAFREVGADITFLESPQGEDEMRQYCASVDGPKAANLIEGGKTPIRTLDELGDMGYSIAFYPLSTLSAATKAMSDVLDAQATGSRDYEDKLMKFGDLRSAVGFDYYI